MKYLLIDFGASRIKIAIYNQITKKIIVNFDKESPFKNSETITKKELNILLKNIIKEVEPVDGIITCTIVGGGWIGDVYHSWKSNNKNNKKHCLISGLFTDTTNYHVHPHHDGSQNPQYKLDILGYIDNIPIYSSLGDTNCVIESLDLKKDEYVINIGTGSQVIYKNNDIVIKKFIPAGRTFLVYDNFFKSCKLNFFKMLNDITPEQVYNSNLDIDLNLFKQAFDYTGGGSISNIQEDNFTINNLLASILRNFVLQYKQFITDESKINIILVGGIPKKISILKTLFEFYYPKNTIKINSDDIENTHLGMIKYLENKCKK